MQLADYLDVEKLKRYINLGLVTARRHNTLPLTIYCYGRKAVFDSVWDDVTTKTRGLIVDDAGEIVARPYEKFFGVGQHPITHPLTIRDMDANFGPPAITEKVNGCLGIFWKYGLHWGVASKGSFHSPHAEFATKWLEEHVEQFGKLVFPEGYTPVFEIICQEIQPHTIKYPTDGLILLDFIKLETGEELDRNEFTDYAIKNHFDYRVTFPYTLEQALNDDDSSLEGYVVTYKIPGQVPYKIKIKFPTFLKNRKIFYEELKQKAVGNEDKYKEIHTKVGDIVKEALTVCTTQKEFAEFFHKPENAFYAPACFALLNYDDDKEKQKKAIWRLVEKRYDNYQK